MPHSCVSLRKALRAAAGSGLALTQTAAMLRQRWALDRRADAGVTLQPGAPIAFEEIMDVSRVAIEAAELARG